jgi:hypothetical protein
MDLVRLKSHFHETFYILTQMSDYFKLYDKTLVIDILDQIIEAILIVDER